MAPVVEDSQAEDTPAEVVDETEKAQSSPDKLIQIASNIHEIVVKPNGEPIKTVQKIFVFIFIYILFHCRSSRL